MLGQNTMNCICNTFQRDNTHTYKEFPLTREKDDSHCKGKTNKNPKQLTHSNPRPLGKQGHT